MTKKNLEPWRTENPSWHVEAFSWPPRAEGWSPDQWWKYANGFRYAGDRIVQTILGGQRGEMDLLLIPTLYLYRHYIELATKASHATS